MKLRCIESNSRNFKVGNIYWRTKERIFEGGSLIVLGEEESEYVLNGAANGYDDMTVCIFDQVVARFEESE